MEYSNKSVLISGGSRGIGLALAELFASKGANITIFARDVDRLELAKTMILGKCKDKSQRILTMQLDVTHDIEVNQVIGNWIFENGCPDILINSAGFAQPGQIEELPLSLFRKTMEVNYFGTVNLTKAVLPSMLEKSEGIIVNISSMSGFLGIFGYTAYSGSKFAVSGFSDALRNEMKPRGIQVSLVFPPDTDTEQLAYESQFKPKVTKEIAGNAGLLKPQQVAQSILRGIEKRQYIITPGLEASLFYALHHLAGKLTFKILDWMSISAWNKTKN
jgi:3-dehydrosphinganine reductase